MKFITIFQMVGLLLSNFSFVVKADDPADAMLAQDKSEIAMFTRFLTLSPANKTRCEAELDAELDKIALAFLSQSLKEIVRAETINKLQLRLAVKNPLRPTAENSSQDYYYCRIPSKTKIPQYRYYTKDDAIDHKRCPFGIRSLTRLEAEYSPVKKSAKQSLVKASATTYMSKLRIKLGGAYVTVRGPYVWTEKNASGTLTPKTVVTDEIFINGVTFNLYAENKISTVCRRSSIPTVPKVIPLKPGDIDLSKSLQATL